MTHFKKCHGNIFTVSVRTTLENALKLEKEVYAAMGRMLDDAIWLGGTALEAVSKRLGKSEKIFTFDNKKSHINGNTLPPLFMLKMLDYADGLTRWSLSLGDLETSQKAIRAAQLMKDLRVMRIDGTIDHPYRQSLKAYFTIIAEVGTGLYARLEAPKNLTVSQPEQADPSVIKCLGRIESRLSSIEKSCVTSMVELYQTSQQKKPSKHKRREREEVEIAVPSCLMKRLFEILMLPSHADAGFSKLLKRNGKINILSKESYVYVLDYAHKTKEQRERGFRQNLVSLFVGRGNLKGKKASQYLNEDVQTLYRATCDESWAYSFVDAVKNAGRRIFNDDGKCLLNVHMLAQMIRVKHDPKIYGKCPRC